MQVGTPIRKIKNSWGSRYKIGRAEMTPDMAFECLLISHDPGVFGVVNRILRDLSICTNICLSSSKAPKLLSSGNTELVVIDWDGEASSALVQEIWKTSRWKKPTIVAISPVDCSLPGVHVVLKKPVTAESGTTSLKDAYSRMVQDHRRHTRCALMMSAKAADESSRVLPVTVLDIGDGGIGLVTKSEVTSGDVLSFHLLLPGAIREIYIQVRVLWTKEYGRAGCEFVRIPPVDLTILRDWLRSKIKIKKPRIAI
jgi:hypothetical protein